MKQRRSISNRPLNHANFISRFMRIHPSALKFIGINESIKKKEIKVGHKRDTNYRFRFVLPFRKFLFTLGALWTQHYFRHFIVTDRLPTPSFDFSSGSNRCNAEYRITKNTFVLYMRAGNSSLLFLLVYSHLVSWKILSMYRELFMKLPFLQCVRLTCP